MISVCMATYNGERFIKQQIDSILSQLSSDDELIISDDGSSDNTIKFISEYNDSRIKLLHHSEKLDVSKCKYAKGFYLASSNFENALRVSKGDYIFLSDQDDVFSANKISVCMEELKKVDFVQHNFCLIDENGKLIDNNCFGNRRFSKGIFANLYKRPFVGCCMAFKRSVLNSVLPFPKYLIGHDLWIGVLACTLFNGKFIERELLQRRKHSNNVSPATSGSGNSLIFKIAYRIRLYFQLRKHLRESKKNDRA